jgi:hypothetical protein
MEIQQFAQIHQDLFTVFLQFPAQHLIHGPNRPDGQELLQVLQLPLLQVQERKAAILQLLLTDADQVLQVLWLLLSVPQLQLQLYRQMGLLQSVPEEA